jgi:hypothetical protein
MTILQNVRSVPAGTLWKTNFADEFSIPTPAIFVVNFPLRPAFKRNIDLIVEIYRVLIGSVPTCADSWPAC